MTSHIFTRLGRWDESIGYNTRAADLAFGERVDGGLVEDHLHSVDYMAYAYLQRGEDNKAREVLTHLKSLDMPIENHAASVYAFAAVPARIAFETQDWAAAAAVEPRWPASIPWDQYPFLEAIPVFARALGAAHTRDLPASCLATCSSSWNGTMKHRLPTKRYSGGRQTGSTASTVLVARPS